MPVKDGAGPLPAAYTPNVPLWSRQETGSFPSLNKGWCRQSDTMSLKDGAGPRPAAYTAYITSPSEPDKKLVASPKLFATNLILHSWLSSFVYFFLSPLAYLFLLATCLLLCLLLLLAVLRAFLLSSASLSFCLLLLPHLACYFACYCSWLSSFVCFSSCPCFFLALSWSPCLQIFSSLPFTETLRLALLLWRAPLVPWGQRISTHLCIDVCTHVCAEMTDVETCNSRERLSAGFFQ